MDLEFQHRDGLFMLWDGNAVRSLRLLYRIIGQAIGTLPSCPLQSRQLSLPVVFTSEQCRYLSDRGLASVYDLAFNKPNKGNENQTKPDQLNFAASTDTFSKVHFSWPLLTNPYSKCRYLTFSCLAGAGLYVSSGHRFGGDWMVYHEDPATCHAVVVIVCLPQANLAPDMSMIQATAVNRVAESCRKRLLFASLSDSSESVSFLPFGWSTLDGRSEVSFDDNWGEDEEEVKLLAQVYSRIVEASHKPLVT